MHGKQPRSEKNAFPQNDPFPLNRHALGRLQIARAVYSERCATPHAVVVDRPSHNVGTHRLLRLRISGVSQRLNRSVQFGSRLGIRWTRDRILLSDLLHLRLGMFPYNRRCWRRRYRGYYGPDDDDAVQVLRQRYGEARSPRKS